MQYKNYRSRLVLFFPMLVGLALSVQATGEEAIIEINAETNLKSWSWQGNGLAIELIQVPPDFIRGSYAARGLPSVLTEAVATRCVFGTIIRNISDKALDYRVADWRYIPSGGPNMGIEKKIKTKTEWLEEWHSMGVRFSWSILADDPTFEVGDWIQGFTTMAEPHGSQLDLKINWTIESKVYEKTLHGLECAPAPAD